MKRWKVNSKSVFGWLLTANLAALWGYGIVHASGITLAASALCGLWAWRNWPEEIR